MAAIDLGRQLDRPIEGLNFFADSLRNLLRPPA